MLACERNAKPFYCYAALNCFLNVNVARSFDTLEPSA